MDNKVIRLDKNYDLRVTTSRARAYVRENPSFEGYVYVDCPDVSDLYIVHSTWVRRCTDKEWNEYFKKYLK